MVVAVCLSVYHVYRADGSLRERALSCHAKPYHVGFQASLLELWPGSGTALRGLTRRIDIIVRGFPRPRLLWPCCCCMQANAKGQSECSDHTYLRSNLPCLKALQNRPDDLTTSHTENRLGIDQQHGYRPWSDMVPAEKTSSDGVPRIT
jgi:hypothetical protein